MILILILCGFVAGCSSPSGTTTPSPTPTIPGITMAFASERVEVYHFHATHQCSSCITLGAYAEETVKTHFASEMEKGTLVFGHINVDLPENRALVERYRPTGPSLWIGVYNRTGFYKEEQTRLWYKLGNKSAYIEFLSAELENRLTRAFS
jgi:hypothetical protein